MTNEELQAKRAEIEAEGGHPEEVAAKIVALYAPENLPAPVEAKEESTT